MVHISFKWYEYGKKLDGDTIGKHITILLLGNILLYYYWETYYYITIGKHVTMLLYYNWENVPLVDD